MDALQEEGEFPNGDPITKDINVGHMHSFPSGLDRDADFASRGVIFAGPMGFYNLLSCPF